MKQSQVGVHPLLSVTVMAGILGLAGYVPLATSAETTGLAGFSQASDQQIAGAAEVVGFDQAHTDAAGSAATLLTKVEVKPEGERLSLVLTGNGVFAHTVKMLGDRRMVLDMPHMQSERHQSQLAVGHALLSRVRFGYHQDKVRLVLDLAQPAEHSVDSIDGRLILTLAPKASADQKAADADMPVTTEPAVASPSMPAAHKASKHCSV